MNKQEMFGTPNSIDELPALYTDLCTCEKMIFDTKKELEGAEIENIDSYRSDLQAFEVVKKQLVQNITDLEKVKFGEEMPRRQSGGLQVPLDKKYVREVQRQINEAFGVHE